MTMSRRGIGMKTESTTNVPKPTLTRSMVSRGSAMNKPKNTLNKPTNQMARQGFNKTKPTETKKPTRTLLSRKK